MLEVSRDAVAAGEEQLVSCAAIKVNIALSAQRPLALAAMYLSRAGVVGSDFAAALR
jgi:hypothetical protein